MDFSAFKNFLFVPRSSNEIKGTLYELENATTYTSNSFLLLPYSNPQVARSSGKFFKIKNSTFLETISTEKESGAENIFLKAKTPKSNYIEHVKSLKKQIQDGNIYEINYCIQFYCENAEIEPFAVFMKLHQLAKAPYSMFFKHGDEFIISASPELFLKKEGSRLSTKPIKGTVRRGHNAEEDLLLKTELQTNLKERTENVMAVDVARNDLSMFAKKGTVHVNKLYNIETFETVHQMVSTVSCEIKENTSFERIIDCTFPMASMTGAPKSRAMQLIDEAEDFKRESYSGAMGIIDEKEDYTLSVIIRSIFYNQETKRLSISVGGAITYLSDPELEYEECLLKANALLKALNAEIVT